MLHRSRLFVSDRTHLIPEKGMSRLIRGTLRALRAYPREALPPAGVWAEDHGRFLLDEAEALERDSRRWPRLPEENGAPRLLRAARRIAETGEIGPPTILRLMREENEKRAWTEAELALLRSALACALMERLRQELTALCREASAYARSAAEAKAFSERPWTRLPSDPSERAHLIRALEETEDGDALRRADEALRRAGETAEKISREQREREVRAGDAMGRCVTSLRRLAQWPFDRIAERLSPAGRVLSIQETYRRMDAESRGMYRRAAARIARRLHIAESAVARAACDLCRDKEGFEADAGYYLLERPELIGESLTQRRPRAFVRRHRQGLFLLPLYGTAALSLAVGIALGAPFYTWPLIPLCASEAARGAYGALLRRLIPARPLPRIGIKKLTAQTRTLVAVPVLLTSRRQALRISWHLAALRCANPDSQLHFLLLADFADHDAQEAPEDGDIVRAARMAVEEMNRRWGGGFYYLHRARTWDADQGRYTGRERKRGALEALNGLLTEGRCADTFVCATGDPAALRDRYAFVITLDADTFLPAGAPQRLAGTLLHPLQRGRYGVIQPRMETAPDAVRTRAQKLLGGRGGTDLYHLAAQDFYQDVFGRGSFVGKGIYEPRLWTERLRGRLPAGRLLSHDLIEGEIAVSALAEDIVLWDGHPSRLAGWEKRLHRWTRGDWQLLPFLKDRRLPLLSRHKIWDNLRRSLAPAARIGLICAGAALRMPALILLGLPWPARGMGVRLWLLPGKAAVCLDAAARALYRQWVSRRKLLSWVTADQGEGSAFPSVPSLLSPVLLGGALLLLSAAGRAWRPGALLGGAWLLSPLWIPWLDGPADRPRPLTPAMETALRSLARDTWRFFAQTVAADTLFLPPDNVQIDPEKAPAMRTSPTNVGLYLLSCCAARQLGIISVAEAARRAADTVRTLENLETWRGHFFNWYDLRTGAPLQPRFVSTVDSGNLAACLTACAQLMREWMRDMTEGESALPARLDALARRMDFSALYDPKARLFRVGADAGTGRLTDACYDILASEARLTSYFAVMTGQAPRKHWAALGRAVTRAGGGSALLSWGGTMFEYLMPSLLLPLVPGTLLGEGCLRALRAQIGYSQPFGISESGAYAFDAQMNYQYRAFGVPELALSGETEGRVTAPYASLLALPFFPRAVMDNIRRMERLGWRGNMGFYEAADRENRAGGPARIVKSHMAHHQGMILCAVCNALCKNALVRAFMTPPEARACADLLWEKAPASVRRRPGLPPRREDRPQDELRRTARSGLPVDTHVLSGGGTAWLLSGQGQGFLRHESMMITRFREEAGSQTGWQLYVRDGRTGEAIRPAVRGEAVFDPGCVRYETGWRGWRVRERLAVDPLTGMAVRAVRVKNEEKTDREAEIVSFLEIAQGGHAADAAHPNFRDLSVRVSPWGGRGLVSRRLPRDEKDRWPLIGHTVIGDAAALVRQGDRQLFLGREGNYALPEQLTCDADACDSRTGDVTAPCLCLRAGVRIGAGQEKTLVFIVCTAENEEALDRLRLTENQRSAFALADTHARMTLRRLHMDGRMLHLYQQMLGAAVWTGQPHQCASFYPAEGRNALWRLAASGEGITVTVNLFEGADRALIRHALRWHGWLREAGISAELIFLCPPEESYLTPCRDAAARLTAAAGDPEGVVIASVSESEARAAEGMARLALRAGVTLAEQLRSLRTRVYSAADRRLSIPAPSSSPDITEYNGFGGFTEDGACWIGRPAPVPWHNLLCGPAFGTLVCETGILHSWHGNSRLGRLTRLSPDAYRATPAEEMYLTDEGGGVWPLIRCAVLFGPGAASYRNRAGGIETASDVFSHRDRPFGVRTVTLRSEEERTVTVTYLARFALGEQGSDTRCRAEEDMVFAQGGMPGIGWAAMAEGRAAALSPAAAFGLAGEKTPPALLNPADGTGSAAVLTRRVSLPARKPVRLTMALGWAASAAEARGDFAALLSQGPGAALRDVREAWERRLGVMTLYAGAPALERMVNLWLPYQTWTARLLARMGPYQQGGAFGFRDQLQDLLPLLYTDPAYARAHILLCAAHQYPEGDVQHWWHPPRRGVRTRISDDRIFLPYITAQYVRVTGDESILEQPVPYLMSPPLSPQEKERYEEPEETSFTEPLLSHCMRALDAAALGPHGLPLMGGGDWNDGMDRVGGQTGESVWLGFFLAMTLEEYAPLCPPDAREAYRERRRRLLADAESAWTGEWYLRAWRDGGRPLGGPDTDPPRIDLISQCFAVLSGAPRDHARTALQNALRILWDRKTGIIRLLDPPFSPEEEAGYIGAYLPGVRENGGQYTHAAAWLILALCKLREYGKAWEALDCLLPSFRAGSPDRARVYRAEPYVLAADVYAGENAGRAGWTWYTGSAAWLYHGILTALLGFEKAGDKARLTPRPGPDTEEYTVAYRFGSARYLFTAAHDALFPTLDGVRLEDGWAALTADGRTHEARFPLRRPDA